MGEYLWLRSWSQFRRLFREKTCRMSLSPSPPRRTHSLSGLFAKRSRARARRSGKSLIRKSHYFDEISLMCSLWECKPARRSVDMNGIPDFWGGGVEIVLSRLQWWCQSIKPRSRQEPAKKFCLKLNFKQVYLMTGRKLNIFISHSQKLMLFNAVTKTKTAVTKYIFTFSPHIC